MCGRFALNTTPSQLSKEFGISVEGEITPHFNILPSQYIAAIKREDNHNQFVMLKWGLLPAWAKKKSIAYKLINARSETVLEKPAFREAIIKRRCIIPASGFYEWHEEGGEHKKPYYIFPKIKDLIGFAGIWEHWQNPDDADEVIDSCSILTVPTEKSLSQLHERKPLILSKDFYQDWLDAEISANSLLKKSELSIPEDNLKFGKVSLRVNNPMNDDAKCIELLESKE